jgi:hypothetical protein
MTTMFEEVTPRIPPFLNDQHGAWIGYRNAAGILTNLGTLYFAASWLSRESAPPWALAMPAGSSPAIITATAFNVLQAFPLIANSFFPMSLPRRKILFLSIRFQPDSLSNQARGTTS